MSHIMYLVSVATQTRQSTMAQMLHLVLAQLCLLLTIRITPDIFVSVTARDLTSDSVSGTLQLFRSRVLEEGIPCALHSDTSLLPEGHPCAVDSQEIGTAVIPSLINSLKRGDPTKGKHPRGVGKRPPGQGKRPPGQGKRPPGQGKRPPGEGKRPPGQGKRPPGVGRRRPRKDDDRSCPVRTVSQATPAAVQKITALYPAALVDKVFLEKVVARLSAKGFKNGNCIALVNTCRDEINRPLTRLIEAEYSYSFDIAGLGGVITSGKIGFKAALSHGPEDALNQTKYIFFAFPHIAVDEKGEVGTVSRPGLHHSTACGALIAVQSLAKANASATAIDEDDVEFSILRNKLLAESSVTEAGPEGPDLVTVTNAALDVANKDLEKLIAATVNTAKADYAVVTGVEINTGAQVEGEEFQWGRALDYISPSLLYTVVKGVKTEFTL